MIVEVDLPADPWLLARLLTLGEGGARGLAMLVSDARGALRACDAASSFVACEPVETFRGDGAYLPDSRAMAWAGERGWAGLPAAPRWVGFVPYESARTLERRSARGTDPRPPPRCARPTWFRYGAVFRIDKARGKVAVEADDLPAARRLVDRARAALASRDASPGVGRGAAALQTWPRDEEGAGAVPFTFRNAGVLPDDEGHAERVRQALGLIAQGDIYQVNLARRFRFTLEGSRLEAFARLFAAAPSPYGLYLDAGDVTLAAASPELALECRAGVIRTAPIKGTRPRGVGAQDARLRHALEHDPKERAELTMALDLHRNDLGVVAEVGSVRVLGEPRVLTGKTVHSRVVEVVARARRGVCLEEIVRAVVPCGSVTGAPKVRAMEVIAELEPSRRGLYTGAYGYLGRDGGLVLAMAIRFLEIARDGACDYFSGGGIVADSDPLREVEETRWKAVQLAALLDPSAGGSVR
jgi:anthranilate/para-aminobenzoate synthase component I